MENTKIYSKPAIVEEIELETRAGSSTIGGIDFGFDVEP